MAFDLGEALKGVSELGTGRQQIEYIRLDLIDEDPNNFYQLSGIEELAANIELCGLQQPIRVRPVPGETERYMIVSGHRRRKAVEMLAQDNLERWGEVPCIVEDDVVSPALQQLRLIYANANTRTMTSSEISEQAVQVEKLLYQLKEEGYEFPGRMRDHVAQAVGASKSKLARLKVIRENLAFAWQSSWKDGSLGESVAYALAQLPAYHQDLIFTACDNPRHLYESSVKEYAKRFQEIDQARCGPRKDVVCTHKVTMLEKSCRDRWSDPCRSRCCMTCGSLRTCKVSCDRAKGEKQKQKDAYKADTQAAARQAEERDRPTIEIIRTVYDRVGTARLAAGVSIEELYQAQGKHYNESIDVEKQARLEAGATKVETNTTLPFGHSFYASDAKALCNVADLLKVSTDYLLGRTQEPRMYEMVALQISEVVSESDTGEAEPEFIPGAWYPVSVEPPVGKTLVLIDSGGYVDTGKYIGCGEYSMDYGDPVVLWGLMPSEKDATQTPPPVAGWHSGKPEAYGTYVAYVKISGSDKKSLRELLWDGEEWFLFGSRISETAEVCCWTDQPEW